MKIVFIRHFMTKGNVKKRYIGTTDESLEQAYLPLKSSLDYPPVEIVISSSKKRCIETAEYIYPEHVPTIVKNLEECDFGVFENKNHEELSADPRYQKWVDSGGRLAFPEGESQNHFKNRCVKRFEDTIRQLIENNIECAAFVVHGGTIMAIMEAFGYPQKTFFDRQVENGHGFLTSIENELWIQGEKVVKEEWEI